MADDRTEIIHPNIKDSRVLTYLNQRNEPAYVNTPEEDKLLELWRLKYCIAKQEYEKGRASKEKVKRWRDAYEGRYYALNKEGKPTQTLIKPIRKLAYELVESKVNGHIPAPKMSPRYHSDLTTVNVTEKMIMHDMNHMLSEETNDRAEHNVLIDSTTWFKVGWNPFDNTHERSGNPVVTVCPVDTVFPQPGVENYKDLEYIFEETNMTVAQILDLYNREIPSPTNNDIVPVVNCYFLNEDRCVGKFSWCEDNGLVICNDLEWGMRKRRECAECHTVVPIDHVCSECGSKNIKYFSVKETRLDEDLVYIENPYRTGSTPDVSQDQNQSDESKTLPAGTVIPHYLIRQLPFVPYRRVMVPGSIYGISEVELVLEDQDTINKLLNKAEKKSLSSKAYVTKLKDTRLDADPESEIAEIEVDSPQDGQAVQVKQVTADINQEILNAQMLYDTAKSTVGVTNTDQGKEDPTARSGKAKQLQMQASAQRNVGPNILRNMAYAGVYELIFKNLLAYCDEDRRFVSLLPDGTQSEQVWSRYMFLEKDDNGELYYRDDFAWSVDTASEITQDRAAMWQLIDNDFLNGTLGTSIDPNRALIMYWQMKDQMGYPLAKYALAFLKEAQQELPTQVEKALVEHPEAVQMALEYIKAQQEAMGLGGGQSNNWGGARANSGLKGNNATHAANVEKTNNANRAASGAAQTNTNAVATGGMQGGTGVNKGVNANG